MSLKDRIKEWVKPVVLQWDKFKSIDTLDLNDLINRWEIERVEGFLDRGGFNAKHQSMLDSSYNALIMRQWHELAYKAVMQGANPMSLSGRSAYGFYKSRLFSHLILNGEWDRAVNYVEQISTRAELQEKWSASEEVSEKSGLMSILAREINRRMSNGVSWEEMEAGALTVLAALEKAGCTVDDRGVCGLTAMHYAAGEVLEASDPTALALTTVPLRARSSVVPWVKVLLDKGADSNAVATPVAGALGERFIKLRGKTPLMSAIHSADLQSAELLWSYGASLHAKNENRDTLLHYAVSRMRAEMATGKSDESYEELLASLGWLRSKSGSLLHNGWCEPNANGQTPDDLALARLHEADLDGHGDWRDRTPKMHHLPITDLIKRAESRFELEDLKQASERTEVVQGPLSQEIGVESSEQTWVAKKPLRHPENTQSVFVKPKRISL